MMSCLSAQVGPGPQCRHWQSRLIFAAGGPHLPTVPRCFMGESLILASEVCHHASPGPRLGLQAQYVEARTKGVRVVPMWAG